MDRTMTQCDGCARVGEIEKYILVSLVLHSKFVFSLHV